MSVLKVEMTGDELKLMETLRKVAAQMKAVGEEGGKAGQSSVAAFRNVQKSQEGCLASLASMAGGYVSVGAAIAFVTKAFTEANAAQERFAAKGRENAQALKGLATLAPGDVGAFQQALSGTRGLMATGNFASMADAAGLYAAAAKGGFAGDLGLLGRLQGIVPDAAALGTAATAFQRATGAGGGMGPIVSGGLAAGRFAPGASTADLLAAAAHAGASARGLGASPDEILAAVTSYGRTAGAGEAGGGIRLLAAAFRKRGGYEGLGLAGSVRKLAGEGLDEAALAQELPRGAYDAFIALRGQLPEMASIQAAITAGRGGDLAGRMAGVPGLEPEIAAAESLGRAGAGAGAAGRLVGVRRNTRQAIIERDVNLWRGRGVPEPLLQAGKWAAEWTSNYLPATGGYLMGTSEEQLIAAGGTREERASANLSGWMPQLIEVIRDAFDRALGQRTLRRPDEDR